MKESITKSIRKSQVIIDLILIIYIIGIFILKDKLNTLIYPINVAFFMLLTFSSIKLLGYRKDKKSKVKDHINNTFIITSTLYLITIYLAGNATGYINNKINIITIIFLTLYIILSEIFRYIFLNKCSKKTNQQYIITFIYILFDILILSSFSPNNFLSIANLMALIITSSIKNALLTYTCLKFGYRPCLIATFILTLIPIYAPIYPKLGNYLNTVFQVTYAAVIFYNISKPIRKTDEESINTYKKSFNFYFERVLLVSVIVTIFLVSGTLKFRISAIASDSMYPSLKRGDAIIIEKVDEKNKDSLKKGMIVAFEQDDQIVTHRILTIELEDGRERIVTKGDNNSTKDVTKKTKDDIIGIVRFRIPLLGYPSVEISEIKNKKE